jgi:Family of unknown function (DUF5989)
MIDEPSPAGQDPQDSRAPSDFQKQAEAPSRSAAAELAAEFWQFLKEEKKWWLIPIILSLLLVAAVALLLHSPAAPFIYPLF